MEFDVRFYLVAILFIIFDLEIAFLFPWAISLGNIGLLGFWSMMIFLAVLTIGFIYEWKKGALRMGINLNLNENKEKKIPEEFKKLAKDFAEKGFITTSTENLINWARTGSLALDDFWFSLLCC